MSVFDLQAKPYRSSVLMAHLARTPGAIQRAGLDIRNDSMMVSSSDAAGMAQLFQPLRTSSGFTVNDITAMTVSTVYACMSKIAGAILQLPVHQYRLDANGDRERMKPTPLWWMLNEQPDAAWTSASWKEWIVKCWGLRGDQVTEIIRSQSASAGGAPVALRPHHPDMVKVRRVSGRNRYDITDPETRTTYTRDQDDVLHFSGFGFDGLHSQSVVQWAARNAIGNALASSDYMGRTIGEGAMPQIALSFPQKLNPEQSRMLRNAFVATYTGTESRKVPLILTEGGTVAELSISPVDMQLIESRRFEKEDICQAFGVPPVMIGENEKTSSWGTGVEQITLGFVRFTLAPMLCRWEEELNRKLFRRAGQFVEFSLAALLRGDSKAQSEAFRAALGGPGTGDGWMSVDEVRKLTNQPALGGEFAEPFRAQRASAKPADPDPNQTSVAQSLALMASREPQSPTINVAAPTVNVTPAPIEMRAGDTHVTLPEGFMQSHTVVNTPEVHVGGVSVDVKPHPGGMRQTVTRDAAGDIEEITTGATRQVITRDAAGDIAAVTTEHIKD